MMPTLVVLMAHGSSDPRWRAPFEALLERLIPLFSAQNQQVALCYMERAQPTLEGVLEAAAQRTTGPLKVVVLPLFMAAGAHYSEDITPLLAQVQAQYPQWHFSLQPPIGEHPKTQALLEALALEALVS